MIGKLKSLPGAAEALALAGVLVFLIQASKFAHIQPSILDEGTYLVKGLLFATGRYIPFQPNGPLTNQMPFSFLIPGFIQVLFENGLRTGRYFSIVLGLFILLGLWIVSRRLGGRWWAAAMVWVVAVNPAYANGYSMAVSEVLVACILTWIFVLVLDEKAAIWRLMLASALAGLLILTRVNMTPVLPFLLIFIFWQFGRRAGIWATVAGLLTTIIGHALYWPGILQMWANWLPSALTPFLDPWRSASLGEKIWDPTIGWANRLASLWDGVRFNFIAILAIAVLGVLIFQPRNWKNHFHYRAAVLIVSLSTALIAAHAWAALWESYCVFCFAGYLEFFSPTMVLLIILVFQSYRFESEKDFATKHQTGRWYALFVMIAIVILFAGVGYGAARVVGPWLIEQPIPRVKIGQLQSGTVPLWGILENGLGIGYKTSRWLAPTLMGFAIGLLLIFLTWISVVTLKRTRVRWPAAARPVNFGLLLAAIAIILGTLFTPSAALTGSLEVNACRGDVIAAMEQVGSHLNEMIPPGSLVYWQGSLSAAPLLYIPQVNIFPAQLNDGYSFREGGDVQELSRFGLWNAEMSAKWRQEADFIIIQEQYYDPSWKQFLEAGQFQELPRTSATDPCAKDSGLRIFRRIR